MIDGKCKRYVLVRGVLFFVMLGGAFEAHANPEPLGIKINQDTMKEVREKYKILGSETHLVDGYENHHLYIKNIPIETLSSAQVVSNSNGIVEGVFLVLDKTKFDEFQRTLKNKYKLISSENPFVGDKHAMFQDGESLIKIASPHMSFKMTIIYATKNLIGMIDNAFIKEDKLKSENNKKLL